MSRTKPRKDVPSKRRHYAPRIVSPDHFKDVQLTNTALEMQALAFTLSGMVKDQTFRLNFVCIRTKKVQGVPEQRWIEWFAESTDGQCYQSIEEFRARAAQRKEQKSA